MAKFGCPTFSSQLLIDLDAVRANYRAIRERAPFAQCGAVVKADAYGLGARRVASALHDEGCRIFFVAQLCEALELQAALPVDRTIVILNGLDAGAEALCATLDFVPALNTMEQAERWRSAAAETRRQLPAALQLDTGMSRLGLSPADAKGLACDGSFGEHIRLRLVLSHLACADEPRNAANAEQLVRFQALASLFPRVPRSIANSCGVALSRDYHLEVLRPGLALYGVPSRALCLGISPVVSLRARVLQIRDLERGAGAGYGLTYRAESARRLATLAIGYGDGWPRSLSNIGAAWHEETRLPIVGRISMDSVTVDISALAPGSIREGDLVDLIGPRQSLDDVAADAGTIPYELLTRLGARHARAYLERGVTTMLMPGEAS